MSYYNDLGDIDYFSFQTNGNLKAIGWLDSAHEYAVGEINRIEYLKIVELLSDPFQPSGFWGYHICDLCQFDGARGKNNLFVPGKNIIYVCPELIIHYIACHKYKPPREFLDAVLNCPDTRSMEYKQLILKNNGRFLAPRNG